MYLYIIGLLSLDPVTYFVITETDPGYLLFIKVLNKFQKKV
jgi:hypothetical protein